MQRLQERVALEREALEDHDLDLERQVLDRLRIVALKRDAGDIWDRQLGPLGRGQDDMAGVRQVARHLHRANARPGQVLVQRVDAQDQYPMGRRAGEHIAHMKGVDQLLLERQVGAGVEAGAHRELEQRQDLAVGARALRLDHGAFLPDLRKRLDNILQGHQVAHRQPGHANVVGLGRLAIPAAQIELGAVDRGLREGQAAFDQQQQRGA